MLKAYYRRRMADITGEPLTPEHGLGDDAMAAAVARRGLLVPRALLDYYSVAGRHPINRQHNRLYPLDELTWEDGRLVYMEENQCVAFWAVAEADARRADPPVWTCLNGEPGVWRPEPDWSPRPYKLSQFLMAMWRWQWEGVQEEPDPAG